MGAPVAIVTAVANTKAGRRTLLGAVAAILLVLAFVMTPLVAIPLAIAGSNVTTATSAAAEIEDAGPAVSGGWGYPLAGDYTKGRGFGYNPVDGCSYCSTDHMGYDMAQGCGATVFAAGPGTVITAGSYQGYGNAVRIDHGNDVVTLYGHMEWESLRVAVGQAVVAGTPLGAEGDTGNSFGCHLHFEVRTSGTPIDPAPFLAARGLPLQ